MGPDVASGAVSNISEVVKHLGSGDVGNLRCNVTCFRVGRDMVVIIYAPEEEIKARANCVKCTSST